MEKSNIELTFEVSPNPKSALTFKAEKGKTKKGHGTENFIPKELLLLSRQKRLEQK